MEYFFKRLEKYIDVRPSTAMTDIIVKIMVEVLSVIGIVTKEIRQGKLSMSFHDDMSPKVDLHAEMFFKRLVGTNDVEDALRRLDKLTQEEVRMAAAEALKITRGIDDKVEGIDGKVKNVDTKVKGIDDMVRGVDSKVQDVDGKVKDVDHKVGSAIQGGQ